MKAGTAARLLNLAVAIAIALIVLVPAAQSLLENDMQLPEMGTQAVYDLELMDSWSLEDNLERAVSGRTGCTVEYGSEMTEVTETGISALCQKIIESGADKATVRDPDGRIIVQDHITYRNDLIVGFGTGVQMPGLAGTVTKMELRTHLISPDGKVDILTNGYGNPNPGEISAICVIPLVVYNIAAAHGCYMGQVVSLEYESMATIDIDMGNKDPISNVCTYSVFKDGGTTSLFVTDCPVTWTGTAKIGDVTVSCTYSEVNVMTMSCEGSISETLEKALEDGCLTIDLDGDGYTMDERMSSSFISAIKAMEATP